MPTIEDLGGGDFAAQLLDWTSAGFHGLLVVLGLVCCFFGWKIFKVIVSATGFVAGAYVGASLGYDLGGQNYLYGALGMFAAALIVGFFAYKIYLVLLFLWGAVIGASIGYQIGLAMDSQSLAGVSVAICAALMGIAASVLQKPLIIVVTSFQGAALLVTGFSFFQGIEVLPRIMALEESERNFEAIRAALGETAGLFYGSILIVGLVATGFQHLVNRDKSAKSDKGDDE